jgi:hypothetical protein
MTDNKSMEVWLVPVAGTRVVLPFRISVLTMIGTAVIEADDFSVASGASGSHTAVPTP